MAEDFEITGNIVHWSSTKSKRVTRLYECLVKLGTTKEKRLMIDIMALRQSYERRKLFEIRWINGNDNPADAMTKGTPNKALETLVSTNQLRVGIEGWVERD